VATTDGTQNLQTLVFA